MPRNCPGLCERVIQLTSDFIDAQSMAESTPSTTPLFSYDMRIVGPLYGLAHHCRDPSIRRKAVALLKSCNRREGIWDSMLTATVAEKVIEIEEEGLGTVLSCNDVPDWARITTVQIEWDLEGKVGRCWYERSSRGISDAVSHVERQFRLMKW